MAYIRHNKGVKSSLRENKGVSRSFGFAQDLGSGLARAERHAKLVLDAVAIAGPGRILGIALCQCPELPPTIAERITNYRAHYVADWVMYRTALAAEARGFGTTRGRFMVWQAKHWESRMSTRTSSS